QQQQQQRQQQQQQQQQQRQQQQQQSVSSNWDAIVAMNGLGSKDNSANSNGDLLKEVMHAYAQK
ncbi:unnamed protein product, partial [Acanthocheilonema viteae]